MEIKNVFSYLKNKTTYWITNSEENQFTNTTKQQESLLNEYIKRGKSSDECMGFIDGVETILELVGELLNEGDLVIVNINELKDKK